MAVKANYTRDSTFWQMQARHSKAIRFTSHYSRLTQDVQLAISQAVVRGEKPVQLELDSDADEVKPCQPWVPLPDLQIPFAAVRWYGDALVRSIVSWFWQGIDEGGDLAWISHFQLYADYMLATGQPGPVHVLPGPQWRNGCDVPNLPLRGFGFKQRTRWFTKVWKEILRHQGIELSFCYRRPRSQMVLMFTGVAAIPWPQYRIQAVDKWMLGIAGVTFRRQSKLLDALPFGVRNPVFPLPVLTSSGW